MLIVGIYMFAAKCFSAMHVSSAHADVIIKVERRDDNRWVIHVSLTHAVVRK